MNKTQIPPKHTSIRLIHSIIFPIFCDKFLLWYDFFSFMLLRL